MAKLRKGIAYKSMEPRPYTRKSKYRKLNFIRATPNNKVVKFNMGDATANFKFNFKLVSKDPVQIRHNSLESGRQTANRFLEKKLGKKAFYFKLRVYPHHILRENALASGAGADRLSTGMKKAFGKPVGIAARVKPNQIIMEVSANNEEIARTALKRASYKMPCACSII